MKTLKLIVGALLFALLVACSVSENLENGYQPGDVTDGMIENKQLYCSAPYRGARAVARFIIRVLGGISIPDACALIDAVSQHGSPTTPSTRTLPENASSE